MPNIQQFAKILSAGSYNHVMPRPADEASLTLRQIALRYIETRENAVHDELITAWAVSLIVSVPLLGTATYSLIKAPDFRFEHLMLPFLLFVLSLFISNMITQSIAIKRRLHSTRKLLVAHDEVLLQFKNDMDELAEGLGLSNYESLAGYDRKMLAGMALRAGATLASESMHFLNSDDATERHQSVATRAQLGKWHTLLGRLDLQPKDGFPAYGRRPKEQSSQITEVAT